ncbi:hypothetical protein Tco_0238238 [Tanacetum coccineum]
MFHSSTYMRSTKKGSTLLLTTTQKLSAPPLLRLRNYLIPAAVFGEIGLGLLFMHIIMTRRELFAKCVLLDSLCEHICSNYPEFTQLGQCKNDGCSSRNGPVIGSPFKLIDSNEFLKLTKAIKTLPSSDSKQNLKVQPVLLHLIHNVISQSVVVAAAEVTSKKNVAKPIIKIATICGSLCKASYKAAVELSESIYGIVVECFDISSLPMYKTDLEVNGKYPCVVEAVRRKLWGALPQPLYDRQKDSIETNPEQLIPALFQFLYISSVHYALPNHNVSTPWFSKSETIPYVPGRQAAFVYLAGSIPNNSYDTANVFKWLSLFLQSDRTNALRHKANFVMMEKDNDPLSVHTKVLYYPQTDAKRLIGLRYGASHQGCWHDFGPVMVTSKSAAYPANYLRNRATTPSTRPAAKSPSYPPT